MPRRPREESPSGIYHVTSRGVSREPIYVDGYDRDWFLTLLADVVDRETWRLFGYCLMTNHFHLIVRAQLGALTRGMQLLKGRFGRLFNDRHDRRGPLFEARFRSVPIRTEAHAIQAIVYIALNPVAAGLTQTAAEWPWSSHRASAGTRERPLFLADLDELGVFGDGVRNATDVYRELVREAERALAIRGQTLGV